MEADDKLNNKLHLYKKTSQHEMSVTVHGPREDMIQRVVDFITRPEVALASRGKQEAFLIDKGFTPEEISIAFERHGAPPSLRSDSWLRPLPHVPYQSSSPTPFQKFHDILKSLALFTWVAYALHKFIKNYIWPWLFGRKPRSGTEAAIENLKSSVSELKTQVTKVNSDLEKVVVLQTEQQNAIRVIGDVKSEVSVVKGILLSRHQFPSVNLTGSSSIPAWQMAAGADAGTSEEENRPNSHSGSQGSESSLELIKESEVAEAYEKTVTSEK